MPLQHRRQRRLRQMEQSYNQFRQFSPKPLRRNRLRLLAMAVRV